MREVDLLDQVAVRDDRGRGIGQRRREPGPREQTAEQEDRIIGNVDPHINGKDKGIDNEEQEGVEQAPEESQSGSLVTGTNFTTDQSPEHLAIANQFMGLVSDLFEEQGDQHPKRKRGLAGSL